MGGGAALFWINNVHLWDREICISNGMGQLGNMELIKQMGLVQSGTICFDSLPLGLNNGEQDHKNMGE